MPDSGCSSSWAWTRDAHLRRPVRGVRLHDRQHADLCGTIVWISLVVVFHQHRLERLEALEQDELAAERGGDAGIFEEGDTDVASRRLRQMHTG